jgi:NADH-quinone oxidoreductase subunit M
VLFGPRRNLPAHEHLHDLNAREILALAPIAVLCLVIGVFPQPLLRAMQPEVSAVAAMYEKSTDEVLVAGLPPLPQPEKN